MRFLGLAAALAWLGTSVVACSSSTSPPSAGSSTSSGGGSLGDSGLVSCASDPLAQAYAPNMVQAGASGHFQFQLAKVLVPNEQGVMTDGSPAYGTNRSIVRVLDPAGKPVVPDPTFPPEISSPWPPGWPVGVLPYMPHHGHPSSSHPTVTDNMDGSYTIDDVYFMMDGLWQVTLHAASGSQTDSAVFGFCIQG